MAKMKKILTLALVLCMCLCFFAVQAFADDTVITGDVTWNDGAVIGPVTISGGTAADPITITVNGTVTVDGQITISDSDDCHVVFTGSGTLKRGTNNAGGAMIMCQGNNRIWNSVEINGITLDGGAVWTGEEHATLDRGTTNTGIASTGGNSSVIFIRFSDVSLNNVILQNQDSRGGKGAPINLGYGDLYIDGSTFCNNYYTSNRGGVIHMRNGATVIAENSSFYGNHGSQGGVIGTSTNSAYASVMEFTGCSFTNNYSNDAGAVFHTQDNQYYGHLKVTGCTIANNSCDTKDRGIVDSSSYTVPVYFTGCTIADNDCSIFGYFSNENTNIYVSNTSISADAYSGKLTMAPLKVIGEADSMLLNEASVNYLMSVYGFVATEAEGYTITAADVANILGEDAAYTMVDVDGNGTLDLVPAASDSFTKLSVTVYDNFPGSDASEAQSVPENMFPGCSFSHEGYVFNGWTDKYGAAITAIAEGSELYAQWKIATPEAIIAVSSHDSVIGVETQYTLSIDEIGNYSDDVTYSYQWYFDESKVEGATSDTLTTHGVDLGWHHYTCKVTAIQSGFATSDTGVSTTTRVKVLPEPEVEPVCYIKETGVEYETLTEAVADANALEGANTIVMLKSIDFDSAKALSVTGDLTIIGEKTISRGNYTGTLFTVPAGSSLTLDGGIVFDGSNNWIFDKALYENDLYNYLNNSIDKYAYSANGGTCGTAAVFVVNGAMTVEDATIQNFFNTKDSNGGDGAIFKVNANATLTMDGALIDHVATYGANSVAHLATNAKWYIEGDTVISNNFGGRNGGICRNDSGQIYMNGGTIKDNAGKNVNGSVFMMYGKGSAFYMTDGTICGNSSVFGANNGRCAAVYLHSQSYMKMTGGTICRNIGGARGGIDSYSSSSVLDINRVDQTFVDGVYAGENLKDAYVASNHPMIVDNVSLLDNTNHDIGHSYNFDTWWVTGGIYTQDVDDFCAKGYVCIPYEDTERTDDYIVVPGYRVSYYSVEETTVTDPETNEPKTEYATTLEAKRFLLLPEDKFWHEVTLYAEDLQLVDDETHSAIKGWHSDVELTQDYDFNTPVEDNIKLYGEWEKTAYEVSYVVNGKTVEKYVVDIGAVIPDYAGETPTKAQTGNTTYRFDKWILVSGTPDGNKIGSTDLVYEADFSDIKLSNDKYVDIPENIPIAPVPEVFTDDHYAYVIGYPDGTVRPSASITRAEVATIFFRLLDDEVRAQFMTTENDFSDVNEGAWYNTAISTMAAMGIVNGYEDGSFQPNKSITRAEFATIAARFDLEATDEGNYFSDISGHWAESDICKAVNNGWVKGYEDGTFRPNELIKRAEAMTLINRVLHRLPASVDDLLEGMVEWSDNANPDAWYYIAIQEATNSHEYSRETEESETETWLELIENRNWAELQ